MKPDTWLPVLEALEGGIAISGEALGERLGVTRAAIWQRVRYLTDCGVRIEATELGYRVADTPYIPDATQLSDALKIEVSVKPEVESTNTELMQSGDRNRLLLTLFQKAGRGRRGRSWVGAPGSALMCSLGLSLEVPTQAISLLPIAVGVRLCQFLNTLGVPAGLKWPNDLWVGDQKLAGLLCECRGDLHDSTYLVVGLGLNLVDSSGLPETATYIAAHTQRSWNDDCTIALLKAVQQAMTVDILLPVADLQASYGAVSILDGRPIRVEGGHRSIEGVAQGIDEQGRLQILTDRGLERVTAGDVSVRPSL